MEKDILQEILNDFNSVSKEEWQAKALKDLNGKELDTLDWEINENTKQTAYCNEEDLPKIDTSILKTHNPDWQIGEHYVVKDYKESNKQLLEDLNHGLNAPFIEFETSPSLAELEILFENVGVQYITTHFKSIEGLEDTWQKFLAKRNLEDVAVFFSDKAIDATQFYNGSSNTKNEINETLSKVKELLDKSDDKVKDINKLTVRFFVNKSYLLSIAKLRAFKLKYVDLLKSYGLKEKLPFIRVEFAPDAYSEDEHDNLINATSMAMSAVLGGANHLIVRPTANTKQAKRLARNIQLILKHESGLHKVADPANGSYYVESLTEKLIGG